MSQNLLKQKYPLLDLVVVGAQKSFTTSLKTYLGEHPSIITHPQQEMAYFNDDKEYAKGYEKTLLHYYRGTEQVNDKKIAAKNAMLYTSEKGIKRLYEHNPNCKIVLSLRNPVDRAYSAYLMEYNYIDSWFPFDQIKSIAEKADTSYWPYNLLIDAGNYAKYLKTICKYFPKEQVMIVLCEELKENPLKVCRQIYKWLGVNDTFCPTIKIHNPTMKRGSKLYARFAVTLFKKGHILRKMASLIIPSCYYYKVGDFIRKANKTKQKFEAMDSAIRQYLIIHYYDANKELEEMTGKNVTVLWSR